MSQSLLTIYIFFFFEEPEAAIQNLEKPPCLAKWPLQAPQKYFLSIYSAACRFAGMGVSVQCISLETHAEQCILLINQIKLFHPPSYVNIGGGEDMESYSNRTRMKNECIEWLTVIQFVSFFWNSEWCTVHTVQLMDTILSKIWNSVTFCLLLNPRTQYINEILNECNNLHSSVKVFENKSAFSLMFQNIPKATSDGNSLA